MFRGFNVGPQEESSAAIRSKLHEAMVELIECKSEIIKLSAHIRKYEDLRLRVEKLSVKIDTLRSMATIEQAPTPGRSAFVYVPKSVFPRPRPSLPSFYRLRRLSDTSIGSL